MADKVEQEKKLASWCNQKFKDAMTAKEKYTEEWMNYMNAWNNSLFEDASVPSFRSNYVTNYIYSTIESMRPIMFDGNVKFEAVPVTKDAMQYCDAINTAFDYEFNRTGMKEKVISNSLYTFCLGTSVFMLPYTYKEGGKDGIDGDVDPVMVNPFNIFPDPLATCVEDAEFIIYATYKHQNVLKKEYPEKAEEIEGADIQYEELVNSRNEGWTTSNQVLILEVWCRDYTQIDVEEEGTEGKKTALKFPNGRVITCAPDLNLILEDKPNPYETGRFPFFLFKDIDVPFQFWGEGEVKWLISPQKAINDLQNQVIDNAKHTANAQWILDKNCGIPKGEITNRAGLIIRKNPGSEVRRESPPAMPMYVSETITRLQQSIENISGVHDITRGQAPGRIESGTAIQILQEAGQTRIRLKITLFEEALSKMGTEWLARMKQFWKKDRLIPVKKSYSESLPTYGLNGIEMQPQIPQQQVMNQANNPMMANPLGTPENGNMTSLQEYDFVSVGKEQINQDYRVQIVSNSSMQTSKSAKLDMLMNMLQFQGEDGLPLIPREAILDCLPNVNKQIILDYFNKLKQERMAQQQQQMMNNQAMQQLQGIGQSVQGLQQRADDEDRKQMQDNFLTQGYQQGMNEGMLLSKQNAKQGEVPPALLQQMASMSDEELAAFLQEHPELAQMA